MKAPFSRGPAPAKGQASYGTGSNASDLQLRGASGTAEGHSTTSPVRPIRLNAPKWVNLALAALILLAIAATLLFGPSWVAAQGQEPGNGDIPPPATPSSVSVTRSDGALTASWPAVPHATSYHVTYSSDGKASWSLAALNHPNASITISGVDNGNTYVVGVRARNSSGDSGWRNSAPAGPFAKPTPTPNSDTDAYPGADTHAYPGADTHAYPGADADAYPGTYLRTDAYSDAGAYLRTRRDERLGRAEI